MAEDKPKTEEEPEVALAEDAATESDAAAQEPEADAPAAEEPAAEEPAAEEPAAEAQEAPAAEETSAAGEDAEEAAGAAEAAPAAADQPAEVLHPKERKRRARSTHTGETRPQLSPEERQAERKRIRAAKAARRRVGRLARREKARKNRSADGAPTAPQVEAVAGTPKVRQGVVVSDKADKTITVRIDVSRRHRRYEKIVRNTATLHAHDERNEAHEGDLVRIVETRPMSRTKRWRLTDVLERAR